MAHKQYAKSEFKVNISIGATADAASCSTLSAFILTPEESNPKI